MVIKCYPSIFPIKSNDGSNHLNVQGVDIIHIVDLETYNNTDLEHDLTFVWFAKHVVHDYNQMLQNAGWLVLWTGARVLEQ
jgi:hypothetical protein